jgi:hypothetical protein
MSARQFTFTHTLERSLVDACGWEGEYEVELVVTYSVTPGQPERGPSYACGGTPAEPAEVEIISVKLDGEEELLTADENDALQAACDARAEEALADEASDYADYRRDQARDEQMTREWEKLT